MIQLNKSKISWTVGLWIVLLCTFSIQNVHAQDSLELKKNIGGELKGLYVGGIFSVVGGAGLGIFANNLADYSRPSLTVITAGIGVAPVSLLGLGLGSAFAKEHTPISSSFQLGIGMGISSPVFGEFVQGSSYRSGLNLRVLSPEIGPWRYSLGFSQYFSEEYVFDEIPAYRGQTELSWWELHFDLQYIIDVNSTFIAYPFIGTQYNRVNSQGKKLQSELLVNYGIGTNIRIYNRWRVFADMQYTLDPDDSPGRMSMSVGVLYKL